MNGVLMNRPLWIAAGLFFVLLLCAAPRVAAQETPYFVTYSHHLEEPGNLDVEVYANYGTQKAGGDFIAPWMELEYGVTAWWTTEFYIDSQTTLGDSTVYRHALGEPLPAADEGALDQPGALRRV
jgi:hypothetical protein